MSPLFSPSGLIYRYVLQSPDRSAQELKILQDWVLERQVPRRSRASPTTPASAATTMQYQVQLDPTELLVVRRDGAADRRSSSPANNANAGGGFYSQGGQFYYVRGLGLVEDARGHRQHRGRRRTTASRST